MGMAFWLLRVMGPYSLSPLRPAGQSGARGKATQDGGEGLANLALDCVSTDQSDLTEAICSNFFHGSRGYKVPIVAHIICKTRCLVPTYLQDNQLHSQLHGEKAAWQWCL